MFHLSLVYVTALGASVLALPSSTGDPAIPERNTSPFGPVPDGLKFEPSFNVVPFWTVINAKQRPKNFWYDSDLLGINGDPAHHRELSAVQCEYEYDLYNGKLTNIRAWYAYGAGTPVMAQLRGYTAISHKEHYHKVLTDGTERFNKIEARLCDGVVWGISFSTNLHPNVIQCGRFDEEHPETGCSYPSLEPPAGRHIVGLWGDSSSIALHGLGLITLAG